jgi:hypothetical protein
MERLKRIKEGIDFNHFHYPETGKFALAFNLNKNDFDWLIEQAEKIKRYEKALEEILDITKDTVELEIFTNIVEKVLKD